MNDNIIYTNGSPLTWYITSTGKIWYVSKEELMSGDAQQRREIIGNSFTTQEEAALAKVKLEAMNRLAPYSETDLVFVDGCPAIITKYHLNKEMFGLLRGDIKLLAGKNI